MTHQGNAAVYRREADAITMPPRPQFESPRTIIRPFSTKAPTPPATRPPRPATLLESSRFGSATYSKEELVAELGSAYLCGICGIVERTVDNSAAYLASWLKALRRTRPSSSTPPPTRRKPPTTSCVTTSPPPTRPTPTKTRRPLDPGTTDHGAPVPDYLNNRRVTTAQVRHCASASTPAKRFSAAPRPAP